MKTVTVRIRGGAVVEIHDTWEKGLAEIKRIYYGWPEAGHDTIKMDFTGRVQQKSWRAPPEHEAWASRNHGEWIVRLEEYEVR